MKRLETVSAKDPRARLATSPISPTDPADSGITEESSS